MLKISVFKVFVADQEEARRFYVDKLGFVVTEDKSMGDFRWLLVSAPDSQDVAIHLAAAKTADEKALTGRQAATEPLFGILTDDCKRDFARMKSQGVQFEGEPKVMPYGTGVMLRDLAGNKIYLNQDPA